MKTIIGTLFLFLGILTSAPSWAQSHHKLNPNAIYQGYYAGAPVPDDVPTQTEMNAVQTTANGAAQVTNNLSDLTNASTARTNLGLGPLATQAGANSAAAIAAGLGYTPPRIGTTTGTAYDGGLGATATTNANTALTNAAAAQTTANAAIPQSAIGSTVAPLVGSVVPPANLPAATTSSLGAVQVGTGLGVSGGTVGVQYGTTSTTAYRGDLGAAATATANAALPATSAGPLATQAGANSAAAIAAGGGALSLDTRFDGRVFYAPFYPNPATGSFCTWTPTGDAGPCINAAITVAAAAGGGSVTMPAGIYGFSTKVVQNNSGVGLVGQGYGSPNNSGNSSYLAQTVLKWDGGTVSGYAIDVEPASAATGLRSADVRDFSVDCQDFVSTCVRIASVVASTIRVGAAEGTVNDVQLSATIAPGMQDDDIWLWSRNLNSNATGILVDHDAGASYNVTLNRFHLLYSYLKGGDGVVFGAEDNNQIDVARSLSNAGVATGRDFVMAAAGYVPPSGQAVVGGAQGYTTIWHTDARVSVQGYNEGSSLVQTVQGGASTASFAPLTLTSSNGTPVGAGQTTGITFPSTAGISVPMMMNCGGTKSGIVTGTSVFAVVNATNIQLSDPTATGTSFVSGTSCAFSYGFTGNQILTGFPAVYTITATGAFTFSITTPTGVHNQTGIVASGGVLAFTDLVLPFSGSAVSGDTWTVTIQQPTLSTNAFMVDQSNNILPPIFAFGSTGKYWEANDLLPQIGSGPGINLGTGTIANTSLKQINIGFGSSTTNGIFASNYAGRVNSSSGFGTLTVGGFTNTASGTYSMTVGGEFNNSSGAAGYSSGYGGTDAGRYANECHGGGEVVAQGDSQNCTGELHALTTSATSTRMTGDGAAANATNCWNLPVNYDSGMTVSVLLEDASGNSALYTTAPFLMQNWNGVMKYGSPSPTFAISSYTTATAQGWAVPTLGAVDTTNRCLNILTPAVANLYAVAKISDMETHH
jgi:hypothetical protein